MLGLLFLCLINTSAINFGWNSITQYNCTEEFQLIIHSLLPKPEGIKLTIYAASYPLPTVPYSSNCKSLVKVILVLKMPKIETMIDVRVMISVDVLAGEHTIQVSFSPIYLKNPLFERVRKIFTLSPWLFP